jgi:hypothetical protein
VLTLILLFVLVAWALRMMRFELPHPRPHPPTPTPGREAQLIVFVPADVMADLRRPAPTPPGPVRREPVPAASSLTEDDLIAFGLALESSDDVLCELVGDGSS